MSDKPLLPELKPVKSSNIEALGHDAAAGQLFVRFKGGAVHRYDGVTARAYEALRQAESIGGHFHAHIKSVYQSTRI